MHVKLLSMLASSRFSKLPVRSGFIVKELQAGNVVLECVAVQ